jgi:arginine/ornithine N-succinyltransferase beta subunit
LEISVRAAHPQVGRVIGVSMSSFAVAEIGYNERNYDNWLVTLVQASERLDVLQTVVNELRRLCEREDVVQSRQVMEVLERHGAIT